ncbi:MAG: hypothetical protein KAV45_15580 [Calditrichia bacterium]|nr:hypothetical protein [Calditrichia bacterium]
MMAYFWLGVAASAVAQIILFIAYIILRKRLKKFKDQREIRNKHNKKMIEHLKQDSELRADYRFQILFYSLSGILTVLIGISLLTLNYIYVIGIPELINVLYWKVFYSFFAILFFGIGVVAIFMAYKKYKLMVQAHPFSTMNEKK